MGLLPGTKWDPSLGQTGLSLFNFTVKSPFCPVCPWDGGGVCPWDDCPTRAVRKMFMCFLFIGFFLLRKRVVSKRVVLADVPPERKPARGYVRQNHPFGNRPFISQWPFLVLTKGWFPKGWFRRMFPGNENRNEGTFAKTTLLRNRPFISQWKELAWLPLQSLAVKKKLFFCCANFGRWKTFKICWKVPVKNF